MRKKMEKETAWATERKKKNPWKNQIVFFRKKSYRNLAAKNLKKKNIEKPKIFKTFQEKQKSLKISKIFSSKKDFKKFYGK